MGFYSGYFGGGGGGGGGAVAPAAPSWLSGIGAGTQAKFGYGPPGSNEPGGGGGGGLYDPREEERRKKKNPWDLFKGTWDVGWGGLAAGEGEFGEGVPPPALSPYLTPTPEYLAHYAPGPPIDVPFSFPAGATVVGGATPGETTPTAEEFLSPTGYEPNVWVFDEKQGEWGFWHYDAFNDAWTWEGSETGTQEMSDYERQALAQSQAQLAAQTAWQQQQLAFWREQEASREAERIMELASNPRNWILYNMETGQESTTPRWLSQMYEGAVEPGAPLGEAAGLGHVPALSRQTYEWLNPTEREQLKGYLSWLGVPPEDWMSNLWWMRGKQPQGARPHEAFRQY